MNNGWLVDEGAVHELLGLKRLVKIPAVNITRFDALGRRWLDAEDILRWLRVNSDTLNLPILKRLHDELAEATGTKET